MRYENYLANEERDERYTEAYEAWCERNEFDPDDPHVEIAFQRLIDDY